MFVYYRSPIGMLRIESNDGKHLDKLFFLHDEKNLEPEPLVCYPLLAEAQRQLDAYFTGKLKLFDLPLRMESTPFTVKIWRELQRIPYAVTISYGELAKRVGSPGAMRAVGRANGRNPFVIVVPCHRVIGSKGHLVGYNAGIERKVWLLEHEMKKCL
jgi:O-6-methylguanine DNA methyltransferase